jgi:hypothetical protein
MSFLLRLSTVNPERSEGSTEPSRLSQFQQRIPIKTEIVPPGIDGFDERDLFLSRPAFDLFFSLHCVAVSPRSFEVHQPIVRVPRGEAARIRLLAVLTDAFW